MVRLEVHHAPGPRYGSPVSLSLVRLREVGGEMADISRKLGNTLNWDFQLMPVQETDPVFGLPPQNQKVLGDWYLRIPRFWDFPNQAGLNYVARKRFKERFPLLKPILNEAMHRRRSTHRHLRKQDGKALASQGVGKLATKKAEFMQGVTKNPVWIKALAEANLLAEDVWTVANNELAPKDIDRLGSQLTLFNN